MLQRFASALYLRRLTSHLQAISTSLDRQTDLLLRLADRFAPVALDESTAERRARTADTGVTHLDPTEAALAMEYVAKTQSSTGHTPDDEEILIHLADEKTHDLHIRLTEREQELQEWLESRQ